MDLQQSSQKSQNDYQSYGSAPEASPDSAEIQEREIEKEILLTEYQTDREAILFAIKDALKKHNYSEAQEFVYKYRIAAKTDEEFTILARLVGQKLEMQRELNKVRVIYDTLEENNIEGRIALCQKALRIDPHNAYFTEELKKYKKTDEIEDKIETYSLAQKLAKSIYSTVATISGFIMLMTEIIFFFVALGTLGLLYTIPSVFAGCVHYTTLLHKNADLTFPELLKRIALNIVLMVSAIIMFGFLY